MSTHCGMKNFLNRLITALRFLFIHLYNPDSHSYYPEKPRKSTLTIWLGNIKWMLKHHEINHYYYMYGFDVKNGNDASCYFGKKEFNRIRTQANRSIRMGDQEACYTCLLRDKFLFYQYLVSLGFPTPEILAICDEKKVFWLDSKKTESLDNLEKHKDIDAFLKEMLGECSTGIYPFELRGGKIYVERKESGLDSLKKIVATKHLIQERIKQHEKMGQLCPASVNTIRLLTVNNHKQVDPIAAILRIGINGSCDNLTTGGVAVGVDIDSGKLTKHGVRRPGFGGIVEEHPVTKIRFEGFEIPYYREMVELAQKLHEFFYGVKCIGWDLAVTESGPVFIEGNDNWEVPTFQFFDNNFKRKFMESIA